MNNLQIQHITPPSDKKMLEEVLRELDDVIIPRLSQRVDIAKYAEKLSDSADLFYVWIDGKIIANCAIYMNKEDVGYISSYAIKKEYHRKGIGRRLWCITLEEAKKRKMREIGLEVFKTNVSALKFYLSQGFKVQIEYDEWFKLVYVI